MEQGKPGIWIGAAVALAVVIVAVSIPRHREPVPTAQPPAARAPKVTPASPTPDRPAAGQPGVAPAVPGAGTPTAEPAPGSPAAPGPTAQARLPVQLPPLSPDVSRESVAEALDNLHFALRDHRAALGGNPVGTNAEITNALFGDNVKQIRQPMPDGSRINGNGELCDPWGTPYFFHQQNAQKMEVRSAGPDLQMWTSDDIQM